MQVSRWYHADECFRYYNFGHECSPEVYTPVGRFTCVDVSDVIVIPDLSLFVHYESMKRQLKRRLIYEYRCDERLKTKTEESTLLVDVEIYTTQTSEESTRHSSARRVDFSVLVRLRGV
jgi:hypothetical protein